MFAMDKLPFNTIVILLVFVTKSYLNYSFIVLINF